MKVSIILTVQNANNYINSFITSIISQTHSNFELIIVDYGSEDGSDSIINHFLSIDKRIKFIDNAKNSSDAKNKAINIAKGKIILFYEPYDKVTKKTIENIVNIYDKANFDLLIGSYIIVRKSKEKNISFKNTLIKKETLFKYFKKLYNEDLFNNLYSKCYIVKNIKKNNLMFDEKLNYYGIIKFNIDYISSLNDSDLICYSNKQINKHLISKETNFNTKKATLSLLDDIHKYKETFISNNNLEISLNKKHIKEIIDYIFIFIKSNKYKDIIDVIDLASGLTIIKHAKRINRLFYSVNLKLVKNKQYFLCYVFNKIFVLG